MIAPFVVFVYSSGTSYKYLWHTKLPYHSCPNILYQPDATLQYGMDILHSFSRVLHGDFELTPPVISLITANLMTIVLAIVLHWDAVTVIFIYWAQSIIIGIFTVITILSADAGAISAAMNRSRAKRGEQGTVLPARVRMEAFMLGPFFAVHYGIFHLVYYFFIVESGFFGVLDVTSPGIWFSCGLFFVNHLFSYLYYRNQVPYDENFMMETFTGPYIRIIPMHFTIMAGAIVIGVLGIIGIESAVPVLVLFLLLKTAADIATHLHKHTGFRKSVTNPMRQEA